MAFIHDGPKVLLTEGKNDCHLIAALCNHYAIPETFGLNECGSDDKALKKLSALIASSQPKEAIGIVLDADNPNLEAKWESVRNRLTPEGYELPDTPIAGGTIVTTVGKPIIGIWLMPDNQVNGMLEDFCARLAPETAIEYAVECVKESQARGISTFKGAHLAKAIIHTYLAWQDEPGMPLGQAVSAKALDPAHETAGQFKDFLLKLFSQDAQVA